MSSRAQWCAELHASRPITAFGSLESAVAAIREGAERNGISNIEAREANVFDELRELEISGERFQTIVLDPPAFARNKSAVERAVAGYKEINLRAMKLLDPGGYLITCSCSYNVREEMFGAVLHEAAVDSHAAVTIVEKRMQGRDHPVLVGDILLVRNAEEMAAYRLPLAR